MPLLRPLHAACSLLLSTGAALGCGVDGTGPVDEVRSLVASPAAIVAAPGDTVRLRLADDRGRAVAPITFGTAGAPAGVDANGLVTALASGTTSVTATLATGGRSIHVDVPVTVLGVALDPAHASLVTGGTLAVRPTFVGDPSAYGPLEWSSSDPTVAAVGTDGSVHGVGLGTARIIVVSLRDPRLRAEAQVSVTCSDVPVRSLSVDPRALTLAPGGTRQLTPTIATGGCGPAPAGAAVTFASTDTAIATVTPSGLVTGRRPGVATIVVAAALAPTVAVEVPVAVVDLPFGERLTVQTITTDDPATPFDPTAVRGTIHVTLNVPNIFGEVRRIEAWLAGRRAVVREGPVAAVSTPSTPVTLDVDTSERDASTGARLYPVGPTMLEVRLEYLPPWGVPQSATLPVALTLVDR
ncbi:MAG: Ig-like domain-containing protein [Gemmatirosa sp.]|nr:Ig-like domain-containing protein [Gemmatirosa sp.]